MSVAGEDRLTDLLNNLSGQALAPRAGKLVYRVDPGVTRADEEFTMKIG